MRPTAPSASSSRWSPAARRTRRRRSGATCPSSPTAQRISRSLRASRSTSPSSMPRGGLCSGCAHSPTSCLARPRAASAVTPTATTARAGPAPPRPMRLGPPVEITPPDWGQENFSYWKVVQPVLDKHCVGCHNARTHPKGVDLSGDRTDFFNVSYDVLTRKGTVWADHPERHGRKAAGQSLHQLDIHGQRLGVEHPRDSTASLGLAGQQGRRHDSGRPSGQRWEATGHDDRRPTAPRVRLDRP